MTAAELRTLLEQVEAHGGPDVGRWFDKSTLWAKGLDYDDGEAIAVGVLKFNLETRGFEINAKSSLLDHSVQLWKSGRLRYGAGGSNDLHALLKAYVAAGNAEGWTP